MNKVDYLLSTQAIRNKAKEVYDLCLHGDGQFILHLEKLDAVADLVIETIKDKYPSLQIPYHSRWGHFSVGGKDRVQTLLNYDATTTEMARMLFDLVIVSVLLDAGAGEQWQYHDRDGTVYTRSEGLAVASFEMFRQGMFSSDPMVPYRADSIALTQMTPEKIATGFQVSDSNPLAGLIGRTELMVRLGKTLENTKYFGNDLHRPGFLFDYLLSQAHHDKIPASKVLDTVLRSLSPIWPGRVTLDSVNLGDCWQHDKLGLIPFHKLSQWLTYSLLEPLEMAGIEVVQLDELTALAEYRNGGLLIDSGLITPKHPLALSQPSAPDTSLIIEWRALTIILIDQLAEIIRRKLNLTAESLPLAKILEGGTWHTGRHLANQKRHGKPPIDIISDGTVF